MAYQYLILDSRGNAVAHGISQQPPSGKLWCLLIDDGDIDRVMSHTHVSLVGSAESVPGLEGRIVRRDGNRVYLEPVRRLGEDVRKNLRIPVRFVSYLYPVSGRWKGRVPIVSKDLSCGGLAFYAPRSLEVGEMVQVVVPVTSQPLVLPMRILRSEWASDGEYVYAGCFVGMVREEESMVREAVFSIQLKVTEQENPALEKGC